jgi:formamidase
VSFGVHKASSGAPEMPLVHFVEEAVPRRREFVATTGIPVAADGRNAYLGVRTAAQAALRGMLRYLTEERGLTNEQAYVLASVVCDLQISEIVNAPNALVSAVLPLDVFTDQRRT